MLFLRFLLKIHSSPILGNCKIKLILKIVKVKFPCIKVRVYV